MTEESNALPTGYNLHRYRIDGVLGAGGFGITYRAIHEALQNEVAIKEYFPAEWAYRDHNGVTVRPNAQGQQPARQGEPPCYQWGLERFLEEAKILVQINHPNVVRVRDYFAANGTAYIVMEYEEGESLSALLQRGGILPEAEIRRLLDDVLPALEAVHSQNYLHRDLKPGNLYVRKRDGRVMLLDFGAARQALGRHTRSVTSVVTPGYSPIEQYVTAGDDYGPWTDIYALGAVMYRCITGAPPTDAPGRVLKDPVEPAAEVGAGLYSHGLLQVVDQALAVHPEHRFQSVAAMRQALQAADHVGGQRNPPWSSLDDPLLDAPPSQRSSRFELPPPHRSEEHSSSVPRVSALLPPLSGVSDWRLGSSPPPLAAGAAEQGDLIPSGDIEDDRAISMPGNKIWDEIREQFSAGGERQDRFQASPTPLVGIGESSVEPPLPKSAYSPEFSEPLLKRPPQSALEHLKKASVSSNSRRALTPEKYADSAKEQAPAAVADGLPREGPLPVEEVEAADAEEEEPIHWRQILWTVFVISSSLGIGLLAYEYYNAVQIERAREAAEIQRRQEEEAARQMAEEAQKQAVEFARRLEQARRAMADRDWERAGRLLDEAAVLDPNNPALAKARNDLQQARKPGALMTYVDPVSDIVFHWVEGGCFVMGSPPTERDRNSDETGHDVCVKNFWISKTEITNRQFERFRAAHDSGSFQGHSLNGDTQPVVNIQWADAQAFVEWLNWEGGGKRFRLPTEAEWEYAARAKTTTRYYWGDEVDSRYANFSDRNDPTGAAVGNLDDGYVVTAPGGHYLPNAFGLHDMAGNVWEWTCSEYTPQYTGEEQRCSIRRPNEGLRVVRGGSWNNGPGELRSAKRLARKPTDRDALTGFRVVMEEG